MYPSGDSKNALDRFTCYICTAVLDSLSQQQLNHIMQHDAAKPVNNACNEIYSNMP